MIDYEKYREEFEAGVKAEIDRETGEIKIGNDFLISPVQVLLDDETAYNYYLRDYVDKKLTDYPEVIYSSFPAPIAYFLYHTHHGYENENQRLQLLRSTWEALIYVLYAYVMGEVQAKGLSLSEVRVFNNQRVKLDYNGILSDKLGWKLEAMKRIIEHDLNNNCILNSSAFITVSDIESIEELNRERNSFSHIAALSPSEAAQSYEELSPIVLEILFGLNFLERVSFLKFSQTMGNVLDVRFFRFDGHSLQKRNFDRTFSADDIADFMPILNENCMLIEFEEEIFNVSPFIHFCRDGDHLKLCYFKKIDRDSGDYILEIIGGRERHLNVANGDISDGIDASLEALL